MYYVYCIWQTNMNLWDISLFSLWTWNVFLSLFTVLHLKNGRDCNMQYTIFRLPFQYHLWLCIQRIWRWYAWNFFFGRNQSLLQFVCIVVNDVFGWYDINLSTNDGLKNEPKNAYMRSIVGKLNANTYTYNQQENTSKNSKLKIAHKRDGFGWLQIVYIVNCSRRIHQGFSFASFFLYFSFALN